MKKSLISLIGALALGATLPALVGPDWQAIEHARKAKQAAQAERHCDVYEAMAPTGAGAVKCPPDAPVLQLDHGPRAIHTVPEPAAQGPLRRAAEGLCRDRA